MTNPTSGHSIARSPEFRITRVFDAPRDLVWKAYSEREHLLRWWGPEGFTMLDADIDARPGGEFRFAMRSPAGQPMSGKWVFHEVDAPSRMTFMLSFTDHVGAVAKHESSPDWPLRMLSTVTFEESVGKTTITITAAAYDASPEEQQVFDDGHTSMMQGYGGTFDQLERYLETIQSRPQGSTG